jgi:hypothetical protein
LADNAEWIEYRHTSPPRTPKRMIGKQQIADFLARVCEANFGITVADEVITKERIAFSVDCAFPDGKHVFEPSSPSSKTERSPGRSMWRLGTRVTEGRKTAKVTRLRLFYVENRTDPEEW